MSYFYFICTFVYDFSIVQYVLKGLRKIALNFNLYIVHDYY